MLICTKIDRTCLREYIANTVARNIRRSAYTRITVENVIGITFIMTRTNIVASVMGIQREGTLLSLRRGVNLLNVIITCIKLVLENSPMRL